MRADNDEEHREGLHSCRRDDDELEAVDRGVHHRGSPDRVSTRLVQVGQGQRRDRRDSQSADPDGRAHGRDDRNMGDGDQRHRPPGRSPERPALAQPPEGVAPPDQLFGQPVEREHADEQPQPVRAQGHRGSAHRRRGREDQQHEPGHTDGDGERPPAGPAQAQPSQYCCDRRAAPDAFDDHGGRQHGSQDRQAPPAGRVDRAGAQQDAAEHREAGEETQNGSGGPDGRGRPGPSWRRQGRRRLRHPPFDRRHLGTSRRAPVASGRVEVRVVGGEGGRAPPRRPATPGGPSVALPGSGDDARWGTCNTRRTGSNRPGAPCRSVERPR